MRPPVQIEKLEALMAAMGRSVKSPGRIYLTGGATALLHGYPPSKAVESSQILAR